MTGQLKWQTERVNDVLDRWLSVDNPDLDQQLAVELWLLQQLQDPYRGMTRHGEVHPNLWFGRIPGSEDGCSALACTYFIFEATRVIRYDNICRLPLPM